MKQKIKNILLTIFLEFLTLLIRFAPKSEKKQVKLKTRWELAQVILHTKEKSAKEILKKYYERLK